MFGFFLGDSTLNHLFRIYHFQISEPESKERSVLCLYLGEWKLKKRNRRFNLSWKVNFEQSLNGHCHTLGTYQESVSLCINLSWAFLSFFVVCLPCRVYAHSFHCVFSLSSIFVHPFRGHTFSLKKKKALPSGTVARPYGLFFLCIVHCHSLKTFSSSFHSSAFQNFAFIFLSFWCSPNTVCVSTITFYYSLFFFLSLSLSLSRSLFIELYFRIVVFRCYSVFSFFVRLLLLLLLFAFSIFLAFLFFFPSQNVFVLSFVILFYFFLSLSYFCSCFSFSCGICDVCLCVKGYRKSKREKSKPK